MIELYNEDCFDTMSKFPDKSIDLVLTSPFYNTNKKAGNNKTLNGTRRSDGEYDYVRYDVHVDNMTNEEYNDYTVKLFEMFDRILNTNGCVLYNISYGAENTEGMFEAVNAIITRTPFTVADVIGWKKSTAFPNSTSKNRLTRIFEFVFVLCRKTETKTFFCNKTITSYRKTGQPAYENVYNFVEAKNNDGSCPFNKATFSSELCEWLLKLYAPQDAFVYDPFMRSGTTAVACERLGLHCIGSEISENQVKYSVNRLKKNFDYLIESEKNFYYELSGMKDNTSDNENTSQYQMSIFDF